MGKIETYLILTLGAFAAGAIIAYLIFKPKVLPPWFAPTGAANTNVRATPVTRYENEEVWTWKDYKGRKREITVHRQVKEDV